MSARRLSALSLPTALVDDLRRLQRDYGCRTRAALIRALVRLARDKDAAPLAREHVKRSSDESAIEYKRSRTHGGKARQAQRRAA